MTYIAVDLGGTNTRVARADSLELPTFGGGPIRRRNKHSYDDDLAFIITSAQKLSGGKPITALGIGVPGRVSDG